MKIDMALLLRMFLRLQKVIFYNNRRLTPIPSGLIKERKK